MIVALDHLVLTVRSIEATTRFYCEVLGMQQQVFGGGRVALRFGRQKINLHRLGGEFEPKAQNPTPGSADICLLTDLPLQEAHARIVAKGVEIIEGIVPRSGAIGPIESFYLRDPDDNLVEISAYADPADR